MNADGDIPKRSATGAMKHPAGNELRELLSRRSSTQIWDDAVDRSVVRHQAAERTERDFSTECPQLAVMAGISSDATERLQRVVDKALGIFPQSHSCCDRFESRNRGLQICVSELCFPYASAHKLTCCLPFGVRLTSKRECVP